MSDDTADLNRHQPCCTRELCLTGTRRCKTCWGEWPCHMRRLSETIADIGLGSLLAALTADSEAVRLRRADGRWCDRP